MLSTAQALTEWDTVLKSLADLKAHAAAHPDQPPPLNVIDRLNHAGFSLEKDLASPLATWKQLLKKKVSRQLQKTSAGALPTGAACCSWVLNPGRQQDVCSLGD